VPQGVGYQGVATDANGIELVNQAISIRASVLSGSATGTIEWEETHATTTDTFGLFTLTIGQGTNTTNGAQANFADISWGTNTHFLKIEMDVTGGANYSFMGTNQMMSVPYALFAESANINYDSISNLLSNDSTFITNVGGGIGGGCDFNYPDGLDGEPIIHDFVANGPYTVPAGKNLYTNMILHNTADDIFINSKKIWNSGLMFSNLNIILSEGDVISLDTMLTTTKVMFGLLVDKKVQSLTYDFVANGAYTVPSGKNLYIYRIYHNSLHCEVNSNAIATNSIFNSDAFLNHHLILKSGDIIDVIDNGSPDFENMFGYLADENYFANCGGGGSSSSSSGLDSATVAAMITSAISNSVSIGIGDYYGGGIVGYIFQPGDADYILGETHGYTLYQDNTGIDWGCIGTTTNVVNNNIGQGPNNTQTLVSLCTETTFAAKWCDDLVIGPYNDWFLPTYLEATLIDPSFYLNHFNFQPNAWNMWLSEEFSVSNPYNYNCPSCSSADNAWTLNYINGYTIQASLKNTSSTSKVIGFRKF